MSTNENLLLQKTTDEVIAKAETVDVEELQKKIDELDAELGSITIKRQAIENQKINLDNQVQLLSKETKKKQKYLKRLKRSRWIFWSVCIVVAVFCIMASGLFAVGVSIKNSFEEFSHGSEEEQLYQAFLEKTQELNKSLEPLKQQKDDLQGEIIRLQYAIAAQGTVSAKEQIVSSSSLLDVESTVLTEQNREELSIYIASLNRHPDMRVELKQYGDFSYYQVVQKYELGRYELNEVNSVIFPGAILRGDSLMHGSGNCALVAQDRTPITIVCSHGGNSIRLDEVNYGTVSEAVKKLWNESEPEYAEKWEYTIHSVQDEEELRLRLGIGSGTAAQFSVGASHTETAHVVAITFTETYFSVAVEPLNNAAAYFQTGCDLYSLGEYEPAYVSSVDYGQRIVVMVTTEMSEDELKAQLGANINGVDINADIAYIQKHIDAGCRISRYGGNTAQTLSMLDSDDIDNINQNIMESDALVNPVPVAYHLNYLSDNAAVPAVAIMNDNIILAENAKLITITLEGNAPGTFRLADAASAIGYVVDVNQIYINKKGETSGAIQFIWDSSQSASMAAFFNDKLHSYSLNTMETEIDNCEVLDTQSGFLSQRETRIHIYISDAVYEIP